MAAAAILDNFEWPYLRNSSRSNYIARIARSSLRWHSFLVSFAEASVLMPLVLKSPLYHRHTIGTVNGGWCTCCYWYSLHSACVQPANVPASYDLTSTVSVDGVSKLTDFGLLHSF